MTRGALNMGPRRLPQAVKNAKCAPAAGCFSTAGKKLYRLPAVQCENSARHFNGTRRDESVV